MVNLSHNFCGPNPSIFTLRKKGRGGFPPFHDGDEEPVYFIFLLRTSTSGQSFISPSNRLRSVFPK